ncbi:MAG: 4-(cytidine 5'-diphospho)-2-C-methyl-D-erythritol kinase, partial [Planctomycetia bacterium]
MQDADDRLTVFAPAKVNLHLEVLGKRRDGYHELETLFLAVSLFDELEFHPAPPGVTTLECDVPHLGTGRENLVVRAVELVRRETGRNDGVRLVLTKRIPLQAGLGGGSSDAAAAIAGLDRWWKLGWSKERQASLGAELGSDVSFFFYSPAAVGRGRGEKLTPIVPGAELPIVVVCP